MQSESRLTNFSFVKNGKKYANENKGSHAISHASRSKYRGGNTSYRGGNTSYRGGNKGVIEGGSKCDGMLISNSNSLFATPA